MDYKMKRHLKEECHWEFIFCLLISDQCVCPSFTHPRERGWEEYKEILDSPPCFSVTSLNGICSCVMQYCHGCCATSSLLPV